MIRWFIYSLIIFLISCSKKNEINEKDYILRYAENLISDVKGKKIICIEELQVKNSKEPFSQKKNHKKIIKLINTECGKCYTELEEWKLFIKSDRSFFNHELDLYFIASGTSNDYFEYVLSNYDYPFTILFDTNGIFLECNRFIEDSRETFLLDENNNIIMRGSPLKNEGIFEVYKILIEK